VYLACTSHRHTGATVLAPLVVSESDIEFAFITCSCSIFCLTVATAHKIGVLVDIRAVGIVEVTPRSSDKVGIVGNIEVTVLTVDELTVVNPDVVRTVDDRNEIDTAYID
jgi:hypothetical protein